MRVRGPTDIDTPRCAQGKTVRCARAYIIAAQVWEAVIMANPAAQDRAMAECTKVISLIARQVGVPGAGAPHPDPAHEARRVRVRADIIGHARIINM